MRKASYNHHDRIRYLRYLQDFLAFEIKWQGDALCCKALCVKLGRLIAAQELLSWGGEAFNPELTRAVNTALKRSRRTSVPWLPIFSGELEQKLDSVVRCLGLHRARAHAPLEVGYVILGVCRPRRVITTRKGCITYVAVPDKGCFDSLAEAKHCYRGLNGHRARLHG